MRLIQVPSLDGALLPLAQMVAESSRGKQTASDLCGFVASGQWQAWSAEGCEVLCLTEMLRHATGKQVLHIRACVGRGLKEWLPLLEQIEAWGRGQGCVAVWATARPGWQRILKGYDLTHVVLEKEL